MIKLLPCPFCGETPFVGPADPEKEGNAWAYVRCINELCHVKPSTTSGISVIDDRGSDKYKEAAIKRWNLRAGAL